MIELSVQPDEVEVGDVASLSVSLNPDLDAEDRSVLVEIGWHTEGRGDQDAATVHTFELEAGSGSDGGSVVLMTAFRIPEGGPVSYDGKLLRIIWQATGTLGPPGDERVATAAFRVIPRRVRA